MVNSIVRKIQNSTSNQTHLNQTQQPREEEKDNKYLNEETIPNPLQNRVCFENTCSQFQIMNVDRLSKITEWIEI